MKETLQQEGAETEQDQINWLDANTPDSNVQHVFARVIPAPASTARARLVSLDAFRGLTIVLMLLVNNIALDVFTPTELTHAPWNGGIRLADLVFPWFLFCVGTAIPFSSASFHRNGLPTWRYALKAVGRAASLIVLGCIVDSSIYKHFVLGLGVLQLIGLAYLVGALLYELPSWSRLTIAAAFLVGYWAAIMCIPTPAGVGVFQEQQNLILHVNNRYLASLHLAGLLSVIPTAALVLIGTSIGEVLRRPDVSGARKAITLGISGVALIAVGLLWNLHLPFNKAVWTSSYILFTAGTASLILGAFFFVIDARGWRWWAYPLVVFGSNAILAYVAPILIKLDALQRLTIISAGEDGDPPTGVAERICLPHRPNGRWMALHDLLHPRVVARALDTVPQEDLPAGVTSNNY